MNAAQFEKHLADLASLLPESVLAYAKELATDDASRAGIAAFLDGQAAKYRKADTAQADAEAKAGEIRAMMKTIKKA